MKISNFISFLIILIWIGIFFATQAGRAEVMGIHEFYAPLMNFYNTTSLTTFPGFELICYFLIFILILTYSKNYVLPNKNLLFFFIITCLFSLFAIFNPFNNLQNGLFSFLSMRITRTIIFFPIMCFTIFFLNYNAFHKVIFKFFRFGLIIGTIKAILDLGSFLTSIGYKNSFDKSITTLGGDVLSWMAIFHIITFSIYVLRKNKTHRNLAILFFMSLFFSYQRTSLLTIVIYDIVFYITISLVTRRFRFIKNAMMSFVIIGSIFFLFVTKTKIGQDLYYRYTSALLFTGIVDESNYSEASYSDSGHLEQSVSTTKFFLQNSSRFWGGGINRRNEEYLQLEGQSKGGVHSNLASLWQYFGIPGVLYIIILFFFFIYNVFTLAKYKFRDAFFPNLYLGISEYFIIRIIVGWFSGDFFFMYSQIVLQYVLLLTLSKLVYYELGKSKLQTYSVNS